MVISNKLENKNTATGWRIFFHFFLFFFFLLLLSKTPIVIYTLVTPTSRLRYVLQRLTTRPLAMSSGIQVATSPLGNGMCCTPPPRARAPTNASLFYSHCSLCYVLYIRCFSTTSQMYRSNPERNVHPGRVLLRLGEALLVPGML